MNKLSYPLIDSFVQLKKSILCVKSEAIAGQLKLILIIIFFGQSFSSKAAASFTPIEGVINSYAKVTAFNPTTNSFTITNILGPVDAFEPGNKALIIQMKGAVINTNNGPNYGSIVSYENAGNYEFVTITERSGTGPSYTVTVDKVQRAYNTNNFVQLVSIPQYENAEITGLVEAVNWEPASGRGGIVAMEVKDTLKLSGAIDVSGKGFIGGMPNAVGSGNNTDNVTYRSASNSNYGQKGEGIAHYVSGEEYGRGALANGGGGGNTHNAGGGGGGSFTQGGDGGTGWDGEGTGGAGGNGLGGKEMKYDPSENKLFFGGGGGGGQQNDGLASQGANGGGIIIIRANDIVANGTNMIAANGASADNSMGNDGAGGGGGGGTILLDVNNYVTDLYSTINIVARGGNGGTVNTVDKHGGGGGGGSGAILTSIPPEEEDIILDNSEGTAGNDCTEPTCVASGQPGYSCVSCFPSGWKPEGDLTILPIALLFFKGKATLDKSNSIEWKTATETNNDFFILEKSKDGKTFHSVAKIAGMGNRSTATFYQYIDKNPFIGQNFYRLTQVDFDGTTTKSPIILVHTTYPKVEIVVSPNPFSDILKIELTSKLSEQAEILMLNANGSPIYREKITIEPGKNDFEYLHGTSLAPGLYLLNIKSAHFGSQFIKIIKQ